eukprot:4907095-Alexandrium_andersonii.AAC.1
MGDHFIVQGRGPLGRRGRRPAGREAPQPHCSMDAGWGSCTRRIRGTPSSRFASCLALIRA